MNVRSLLFTILLPAVAIHTGTAAPVNTLLDVRVGPHKRFDRVVFEFETEATPRLVLKNNQRVEVRFADVRVPEAFSLPGLPRGLTVMRGIDVYREGESGVVFEITLARDAVPTELPLDGRPWRLALDLAPRVSEKADEKPQYVPGDQPIPTKFAEVETKTVDSATAAHRHAVMAFFHLAQGDTRRALEQARLYAKMSGTPLDLELDKPVAQAPTATSPRPQAAAKWSLLKLSPALLSGIAFAFGLVVGLVARGLLGKVHFNFHRAPRAPRPPRPKKKARDLAEELEQDLTTLDEAVEQEPPRKSVSESGSSDAALGTDAEKELRETVMDRRVSRVLELSRGGQSVAAIAEELQMGQDEVKLILDLNQQ